MSEKTQFHIRRFETLRSDRGNFNGQWEEAADRVLPAHRHSFTGKMSNQSEGQKKTELQFDATVAMAAYRFAAVTESLSTPQNSLWHLLKPIDKSLRKNRAVRMFFDDLAEVLFNYRYHPRANFVSNSQQAYLGLGVYGNGTLYIDAPERGRGLRYKSIHLGEAYYAENHAGVVDTIYRLFQLTAQQILDKFIAPEDFIPESIREAAKSSTLMDKKHDILHCVYPRSDVDPQRVDAKGKPFASLYIFVESQEEMRESGYDVFPYAITRYTQAPGETYGRGPAQIVLPAIKVLNEQKKTLLKQGHRIVDPVLLTHDDGKLGTLSLRAGAQNPGGVSKDGKALVHVLPTGNIAVGDKMMDMEKSLINDAFLVTLFQILVDTPQMTATEVLERAREKGMLLAPFAGRMSAEFLGPMIEREISLLAAQGLMPPLPPILQQAAAEYRIVYDNPLSRMARAEKAAGFMRALDTAANYAKMTGDLEPLDWFDFDTATPAILDINGAPTEWTRSLEDVQARRDSRAKSAQMQQMVEAAPAMAAVAKQAHGAAA